MNSKTKVLILDDDDSIRWVLQRALEDAGFETTTLTSTEGCEEIISKQNPAAILSDIRMPGEDGLSFVERISKQFPKLPIILMTAHSDLETAVKAYEVGAFDYLPKPFDLDEMLTLVQRAVESNLDDEQTKQKPPVKTTRIIGEAAAMQVVFKAIGRLSRSEVTVLINGESGTGKELVATAIHENSPRKKGAFIAINMAAIPADLIESELFGHEKGAFTGATEMRAGRFEQANGGTLFLDEIGDMPMAAQTRLLRVLAEGKFFRVGGKKSIQTDVRILTATHRSLQELVDNGQFREDLFHRLNVVKLELPPLRKRKQDIPLLIECFLARVANEMGVVTKHLKPEVFELLKKNPWPGNVRELENLCRWLTVMVTGTNLDIGDLPKNFRNQPVQDEHWKKQLQLFITEELLSGNNNAAIECQQQFEQLLLKTVLKHTQGHRQKTAEILGWGRNTVTRKIKKLEEK